MIRVFVFSLVALLVFQVSSVCAGAVFDINGDGTCGLEEAVYALQVASGIKTQKDYRQEMRSFTEEISDYGHPSFVS
ncbi:MAG: hypothetical protein B6245_18785 [Desulfobacteraceae bacterium 4572_88]|nr:MAG: hypothetical protein B6245_18785 [Desulfobacteraceae bacterium 4572_88]